MVSIAPNWRARLLAIITNPNIAYLLLLAGIYGIMFEFFSPGAYFPGVLGSIALLVGLYALNLLPISYAGAGLLLLGMAMMLAEAFLPSFGVVGIGGIAAFVIGSLLLFPGQTPGFALSWSAIIAATVVSAGFLMLVVTLVWRAHRRTVVTGDTLLIGRPAQVTALGQGRRRGAGERRALARHVRRAARARPARAHRRPPQPDAFGRAGSERFTETLRSEPCPSRAT